MRILITIAMCLAPIALGAGILSDDVMHSPGRVLSVVWCQEGRCQQAAYAPTDNCHQRRREELRRLWDAGVRVTFAACAEK